MTTRLAAVAAAFLFTGAVWAQDVEPSHNGKKLSEWLTAVKDKDLKVKLEAIEALGAIGPAAKPAVPALTILVRKNNDSTIRRAAIESLAMIGAEAKSALAELGGQLRDPDVAVAETAVTAIGKIGLAAKLKTPVATLTTAVRENYKDHIETEKQDNKDRKNNPFGFPTPAARKVVADPQWTVRIAAIKALAEYGPDAKSAIPALVDALLQSVVVHIPANKDAAAAANNPIFNRFVPRGRGRMSRDFNRITGTKDVWHTNRLGDQGDSYKGDQTFWNTAAAAVEAIRKIDTTAGVKAVIGKMRAAGEYDRVRAMVALEWLAPDTKDALQNLMDALRDLSPEVREKAAYALGAMGTIGKPATRALTDLTRDADEDVKKAAAEALEQLKVEKTPTAPPAVVAKADPKADPKATEKDDPAKLEALVRESAIAEFNKRIFTAREAIEKNELEKAQTAISSAEELLKSAAEFLPAKGAEQVKELDDVKEALKVKKAAATGGGS